MKPNIKLVWAITVVTGAIFLFNSCKKTDHSVNNKEAEDTRARAIKGTIERYGRVTAPIIIPFHQEASFISYVDHNGNTIQFGGGSNRTDAICGQYTCATTQDPNDLYVTAYIDHFKWFYTCGGGHDLTAVWKVSTPYTLLAQDPNNSNNYSYGNIRIKNSGGTVLVTSGNFGNGNLQITSQGTDPNCSANTLYLVTFKWDNVSDSYFPDNYVEAQFTIYNNCTITNYNLVVGWTGGPPGVSSFYDIFTHPCDRTDQAFINPETGQNNCATIAGAYVLCTPPTGFTPIDLHQAEYRAVNNSSSNEWVDQTSTVYRGIVAATGLPATTLNPYTDVLYLLNMTPNTGKWLVRYRNIYSTTCVSFGAPPQTWSGNWIQELWDL